MKRKTHYFVFIGILIMINPGTNFAQQDIVFNSTSFEIKLRDNLIDSNRISISYSNAPNLPDKVFYQLKLDNAISYNFTIEDELIVNSNLITNGRSITLNLVTPRETVELGSREAPTSIWNHVKHLYSNWTFGTNPPADGCGFGQGVVADVQILSAIMNQTVSSENELIDYGEDVFNLFFGSSIDLDLDGTAISRSDGFGLFNYSIGMRDHIRNAGNAAEDQTSEIAVTAKDIVNQYSTVVDEGDATEAFKNLNSSTTLYGQIYRQIEDILANASSSNFLILTDDLNLLLNDLTSFSINQYTKFRSTVFDFTIKPENFTVTLLVATTIVNGTTNSNNEESNDGFVNFQFFNVSFILIPVITYKLRSRRNKT